jgi:hypothetical protein
VKRDINGLSAVFGEFAISFWLEVTSAGLCQIIHCSDWLKLRRTQCEKMSSGLPVCTENPILIYQVTESAKLAE